MTDDNTPITLREACELIFHGTMKVATLRAEAERGRLAIFKVGRRLYTTRSSVNEMIRLCRVEPKARGFIATNGATNGLSETAQASLARAALEETLRALKSGSRNTSPQSTGRRAQTTRA